MHTRAHVVNAHEQFQQYRARLRVRSAREPKAERKGSAADVVAKEQAGRVRVTHEGGTATMMRTMRVRMRMRGRMRMRMEMRMGRVCLRLRLSWLLCLVAMRAANVHAIVVVFIVTLTVLIRMIVRFIAIVITVIIVIVITIVVVVVASRCGRLHAPRIAFRRNPRHCQRRCRC